MNVASMAIKSTVAAGTLVNVIGNEKEEEKNIVYYCTYSTLSPTH